MAVLLPMLLPLVAAADVLAAVATCCCLCGVQLLSSACEQHFPCQATFLREPAVLCVAGMPGLDEVSVAGSTCSIAMERCHVAARKLAHTESWRTRLDPSEQLDRAQTEALLRETAAAAAEVGRAETWLAMERADTRAIWGGASTKGGEPSGHDAAAMGTLQEMMHLGTAAGE